MSKEQNLETGIVKHLGGWAGDGKGSFDKVADKLAS